MSEIHLVTGASSGVGRALCKWFAQQGLNVLGVARRAGELEKLRLEQPEYIRVLACDLGDASGRAELVAAVAGEYVVRSLTHSAAIAPHDLMQEMSDEDWRRVMAVNLDAPVLLTRDIIPHMPDGARVLHLSSGSAYKATKAGGPYCISKAALLMAKEAWNADLQGRVLVGSAMPGVVDGPMQDAARNETNPSADLFRSFKVQGRLIQPERVAQFLGWLLTSTDDEGFTSGDWNIFDDAHHQHWLDGALSG